MVLLGGLELVAAGYLVHRHQKNKREKQRLQDQAAFAQQQHQQQQQQQQHPQQQHRHEQPRKHRHREKRSSSRPPHASVPPPPSYPSQPKPEFYTPYAAATWRPHQSAVDVSQIPVANGTPPGQRYPQTGYQQPYGHLPPPPPFPPLNPQPVVHHPYGGSTSPSYPYHAASTPNLVPGYQSNTGLSDDSDRLSVDGLEVYEPSQPHVRFSLPDGPQPGEQHDPPPPYRP